ncbi:hypothetical protein [Bradyrhizobium sp. SZCCHNR1098]|uniref:hypothetical protein n=1 Tax=Bradyrhizobium sp. SZCCHNR1098 TaxID=3057370 RepID=UPI002916D7EF|nr:hypothetical protein [Bradyrhizobium sp. SZCCHNR1098]
MGSKDTQTSNTQQSQTYTPAGGSYLTNALNQAQGLAGQNLTVPTAPVAGFQPLQQQAFGAIQGAQGMAQPYYQQAQNYFSPQGAQAFFNPFADAVTAQMQNVFGQQNQQNTANLVQSAGGVGADRIAVGQGNLANQQALAAGQTYANLYGQAQQQAQQAGQNIAGLGTTAQNTALQGANALLGAGGLQQSLAQRQLNAPYQQQLAQMALPFQLSNFFSNTAGALAPGLGGTTSGQGTTSSQYNPSLWSQILGGGAALAGIGGGLSGGDLSALNPFGSSPSYGGGNMWSGDAYGGSSANPLPGLTAADYGAGFAEGGAAEDDVIDPHNWMAADSGLIPVAQIARATAPKPNLNLTPPAPSKGGSGGGGLGDVISTVGKMAMMFAARGGAINPFANGGEVSDQERQLGMDYLRQAFTDPTRQQGMDKLRDVMQRQYGINPNDPIRLDPQADAAWRASVDASNETPAAVSAPAGAAAAAPAAAPGAPPAPAAAAASPPAANPFAPPQRSSMQQFMSSPYGALLAGGLSLMAGRPALEGLAFAQKQEGIDQASQRLELEAQKHADELEAAKELTPYQKASLDLQRERLAAVQGKEKPLPASLLKDLGEKATSANQLRALETGFKPDYAGSGSATIGDVKNWAARQFNIGNTDAADWWQSYQGYQNKVRHELFGSALTATEAAQWERQSINPGMAPDRIKANLARQREIVEGALRRRADSLKKQGYSAEGIDAEVGPLGKSTGAPQVGEIRTNAHGVKGRWTGQGWEVIH